MPFMLNMRETTTIVLKRITKEKLDGLGSKGDTYNDIIVRLLKKNGAKR